MPHLPLSICTTSLSSSSSIFPPISQTPTIRLEHNEHSGPGERSHCDDLRQSGSFTQTVTHTGYEPSIKCRKDFWEKNYPNTITEDVTVPNSTKISKKSFIQSQMHSDYDSAESIADSDLEDGESLYGQESNAPGKPAAIIKERRNDSGEYQKVESNYTGAPRGAQAKRGAYPFFCRTKVDKNKMADAEMAAELQSLQAREERRGRHDPQKGDCCMEALW